MSHKPERKTFMHDDAKARAFFEDVRKLHSPDRPEDGAQKPLPKSQAQSARCALAACSLPVSSVNALTESWHVSAIFEENADVKATLLRCLKELRAEMVRANERQPQENSGDEPRP